MKQKLLLERRGNVAACTARWGSFQHVPSVLPSDRRTAVTSWRLVCSAGLCGGWRFFSYCSHETAGADTVAPGVTMGFVCCRKSVSRVFCNRFKAGAEERQHRRDPCTKHTACGSSHTPCLGEYLKQMFKMTQRQSSGEASLSSASANTGREAKRLRAVLQRGSERVPNPPCNSCI